jgi:hypothetical protein
MIAVDFAHLPNVYGEGALFAFSGIDGQTQVSSEFVTTFSAERYGLVIHTPMRRFLNITMPAGAAHSPRIATGDVLWVDCDSTSLIITWAAWHTLVGKLPTGATIDLSIEGETVRKEGSRIITETPRDAIVLVQQDDRFALAYGESVNMALLPCGTGTHPQDRAQRISAIGMV